MTTTALAVGAAVVALAFALSTYERWLARRKRHELAWSVSLGFFCLASLALAAGAGLGWNETSFRLFYLFGAIVNVPYLALGTVYLLAGERVGDRTAIGVTLVAVFAAGVLLTAPLTGDIPADRLPQGSDVFGALPRILAAVCSGVGALVVFGGAAWSAWRYRTGRMLWTNVLIALGTVLLSASGLLNSVLDEMAGFAVMLTAGITVLFCGFLVSVSAGRDAAASRRRLAGARPRT